MHVTSLSQGGTLDHFLLNDGSLFISDVSRPKCLSSHDFVNLLSIPERKFASKSAMNAMTIQNYLREKM